MDTIEEETNIYQNVQQDQAQYSGMLQAGHSDQLIENIISPQKRVKNLVHHLAGKQYNYKTKRWEVDADKRVFNDKFESFLIGQLMAIMNQDVIMTRFDDEEFINRACERFMAFMIIHINLNMEEYGFRDNGSLTVFIENLGTVLYASLRRGFMQGERKFLNLSTKQELTQIQQPQANKKSFFGGLLGSK